MRVILAAVFTLLSPAGFAASSLGHNAKPPAAPHSIAPTKVAWYDASRPTAITPAAPMPGVGPKDVLVEGLTLNTALLPISLPIPPIREVTAYTALQFHVPDGATPGSLTLHLTGFSTAVIDGKLPSGVTPIACPATSSFKSGQQQSTNAAPKYDCSKRSTVGQLGDGGKTVVFPGISRLLTGDTLSVVILPGSLGLERLVFSPPDSSTLGLLDFTLPGGESPPSVTPVPAPSAPASTSPHVGGTTPTLPLPPAQTLAPSAPTPVIAPTSTAPAITTVAASAPDDHSERAKAIALLVALVVAVLWLSLSERRVQVAEWGVGRFRSQRNGPPPAI